MIAGFDRFDEGAHRVATRSRDGRPTAAPGARMVRNADRRGRCRPQPRRRIGGAAVRERGEIFDSGWVGAGEEDDLDRRLAAEAEPFDLRRPHVMTALGPIEPAALGPTLAAERISSGPPPSASNGEPADDPHATLAELEDLYAAGGRAVLDATTDQGRDATVLGWIAARAPVHLVAVTGAQSDATSGGDSATLAKRLAASFVEELTEGIAGTAIRAGAILVRMGDDGFGGGVATAFRAAALAHRSIAAPVLLRVARPDLAPAALATMGGEGVASENVVVGGFTGRTEVRDLETILMTGASLALDRLAGNGSWPVAEQAATIGSLVAAGHGERLLLSPGLDRRSSLRAYGGEPGWVWLFERFALLLMETGLEAAAVRRLLVYNPARALTIRVERNEKEGQ